MKSIITVHATMTPPSRDLTRRDIDIRDRQAGYSEIGFHYIIRRNGAVEKGRGDESASVHDEVNLARHAISICVVGGVDDQGEPANNFTEEQNVRIRWLTTDLAQSHPLTKIVAVSPCFEFTPDQCRWR